MTLLSQLTDDQFALVGCGTALLAAFAVMTVSYHVGNLVRRHGSTSTNLHVAQRGMQTGVETADEQKSTRRRAA